MSITRATVETKLKATIVTYGCNLTLERFNKSSSMTVTGYDSLYEEARTHDTNIVSGYSKVYDAAVTFSGYPIFHVTEEILLANGYSNETVDFAVVTVDDFLRPALNVVFIAPNMLRDDLITFSGVRYQVIGNKPFGYFQPDFIGQWVFAKFFEET